MVQKYFMGEVIKSRLNPPAQCREDGPNDAVNLEAGICSNGTRSPGTAGASWGRRWIVRGGGDTKLFS